MQERVLANARLVLPDGTRRGSLCLRGGLIAALDDAGAVPPGADDLGGDLLIPGIVDLHTDNLERQVQPRTNARWPSRDAFVAHDAHCAAAGITTVLNAFCVGDLGYEQGRIQTFHDGLRDGAALAGQGLLKADHRLHLRCELPAADMQALFDPVSRHPSLCLVSLMDHTPGYGQYGDTTRFRSLRRLDGMAEDAIDALIDAQHELRDRYRGPNRAHVLAALAGRAVVLASHDDRTVAEVAENHAAGIGVSEFPVTLAAARAARSLGMQVIAGAPNLVRGGSHSGNVAVADLLAEDLVDAMASDYVPGSLVAAAFMAPADGIAAQVARVTDRPARMAGLHDRGRLQAGLRADLVQVHLAQVGGVPLAVVRRVWRGGERVI